MSITIDAVRSAARLHSDPALEDLARADFPHPLQRPERAETNPDYLIDATLIAFAQGTLAEAPSAARRDVIDHTLTVTEQFINYLS